MFVANRLLPGMAYATGVQKPIAVPARSNTCTLPAPAADCAALKRPMTHGSVLELVFGRMPAVTGAMQASLAIGTPETAGRPNWPQTFVDVTFSIAARSRSDAVELEL